MTTAILWQCTADECTWSDPPRGNILHPRTWARLLGGCHPHSVADPHVWDWRGRHLALPHWSGGKVSHSSAAFVLSKTHPQHSGVQNRALNLDRVGRLFHRQGGNEFQAAGVTKLKERWLNSFKWHLGGCTMFACAEQWWDGSVCKSDSTQKLPPISHNRMLLEASAAYLTMVFCGLIFCFCVFRTSSVFFLFIYSGNKIKCLHLW